MDNNTILNLLEKLRDYLLEELKANTIAELCKNQYDAIKNGKIFIFDNGQKQILSELKKLSKNTSIDFSFNNKLADYLNLNNNSLIKYFEHEFERVFNEIIKSGRQDEIQALFIEYDYYYAFKSSIVCYGMQDYPLVYEPRYLKGEYDYNLKILFIENGINFQPAWSNCEEFEELEILDINYKIENLFKLHSRVLLHKALENLKTMGELNFIKNQPFSFYINEHDSEVMMLYRYPFH